MKQISFPCHKLEHEGNGDTNEVGAVNDHKRLEKESRRIGNPLKNRDNYYNIGQIRALHHLE